ncbi:MAG: DUF6382 domain-containing protein [Oscillospiraceae bacterium]|nr:DUF6382 domain-containing protein [Oscillospiraceae bacterium]
MSYKIECKNDTLTGETVTVTICESDLDKKALYTILFDTPKFILPFNYVHIDGEVRFVYQVGLHCKLQHLTGAWEKKEYIELWTSIINPLFDCKDWFMQSDGFLLKSEHIFYNQETKSVCFVYIPSIHCTSDQSSVQELVADVSELISVDDAYLENKLLKAIMKNFDPEDILKLLRSYIPEADILSERSYLPESQVSSGQVPANGLSDMSITKRLPESRAPVYTHLTQKKESMYVSKQESTQSDFGDIIIDIPERRVKAKKDRKKKVRNEEDTAPRERIYGNILGAIFGRKD